MQDNIKLMHQVWQDYTSDHRRPTQLPQIDFEEIVSAVFAVGPLYYYILDFYDLSISQFSPWFEEAHGRKVEEFHVINDILAMIHPEDIDFVIKAEAKASDYIFKVLGADKITEYKVSYNFRFLTANGNYEYFNHQSLILTVDDNGNFSKSINIHTNINHLVQENSHRFSMIGLGDNPSYLNLEVFSDEDDRKALENGIFTGREIEVIKLIADGVSTNGIANQLSISTETVKSHRKNILRKSGCTSSTELVARGVSEGWI
ncbi:LuxR C-terminal-related transcriptional regulator [Pleomorphovibrio marinus]|uniref:LuxR C-terminal-related transcriptional regulator n=1 Tax=Pleomorphovibrio marinus TaxID=2164132 RepID=UPI000E0C6992|nr:LuxR C-terminal-related transcriptional regulator [Pleomorphovibrio marinus]